MGTILDKIVAEKRKEVNSNKERFPPNSLESTDFFKRECFSMKDFIRRPELSGIIAEVKRKSPSKGIINDDFSVGQVSKGYVNAGASGLSILTDRDFFGGSNEDLLCARKINSCPILRKDFIIDEYQIIEAKSIGADVILLIAACLSSDELRNFAACAKSLGLEVLMEIHNELELDKTLNEHLDIVGVNNRNLKTFKTSLDTSYDLVDKIPNEFLKISESGLQFPETLIDLGKAGFEGFLMGENFMKHENPDLACQDFIMQLRGLEDAQTQSPL